MSVPIVIKVVLVVVLVCVCREFAKSQDYKGGIAWVVLNGSGCQVGG